VTRFVSILVFCGGASFCAGESRAGGIGLQDRRRRVAARLVSRIEPEYSEEARRLGSNATVILSLVVNDDGSVRSLKVARGAGFGLDDKALEAAAQWRFQPGMKAEKQCRYRHNRDELQIAGAGLADGAHHVPAQGVAPPVAIKGRLPKYKPPAPSTFH